MTPPSESDLWKLTRHELVRRLKRRWPGAQAARSTRCRACEALGDQRLDDEVPADVWPSVEQALVLLPQASSLRECRHCGALFETTVTGPPAADSLFETNTLFRRLTPAEAIERLGGVVSAPDEPPPLLRAAAAGDEQAVGDLLARGTPADSADDFRNTPLLEACRAGRGDMVRRLLAAGAVPSAANGAGETPLMAAAARGDDALVELLLDHGADATSRNTDARTAAELAASAGHAALAERLQRARDLWPFTSGRWFLRNFEHVQESRADCERFVFHHEGRVLDAWWNTREGRLAEVHALSLEEFHRLLSHGRYDERSRFVGRYADIPRAVREAAAGASSGAAGIAQRLAAAPGQEWLDVRSPGIEGRWYLWRGASGWFRLCGALGVQLMSEDGARSEIDDAVARRAGAAPEPADPRVVREADQAAEKADAALARLLAGDVWYEKGHAHFAIGERLYGAFWEGKGAVEALHEVSRDALRGMLVERNAGRGQGPLLGPNPALRAAIATVEDPARYLELLRAGDIVVGGGATTETTWLLCGRDGRFVIDRGDSSGERSEEELSEARVREILEHKRYGWVKPASR